MDWAKEGLLDGLENGARESRRALLDALHDDGATLEELTAAVREDRLALLPIERALLAPPRHTLAQVAEQAGVAPDAAEARLRALGVHVPADPATAAFGDDDVEAVRRAASYTAAGVVPEENRSVMHVMSGAMARTAEPMRLAFAQAFLRAGDSEDELGRRFATMAEQLLPLVGADLDYLLRHHIRDLVRNDVLGVTERESGQIPDATDLAVAFADIVGFTRLGQEVPDVELTDIAERLDELASTHVERPARVVKTIGDAVMVVSRDAGALVAAMLALVQAASETDGFPPLRAGVAYGRAVPRLGDWFGPTVNLASRLCERARPESVLVTKEVRDAIGTAADRFEFSDAGAKRLKGYKDPLPTLRVRPASG